jgi:hypothetical protein
MKGASAERRGARDCGDTTFDVILTVFELASTASVVKVDDSGVQQRARRDGRAL